MMLSAALIKQRAAELGFAACGIAPAEPLPPTRQAEWLRWIEAGKQGDMNYLAQHLDKKFDPRLLVEGARCVISVAVNYYHATSAPHPFTTKGAKSDDENGENSTESSLASQQNGWRLAQYAYGTDYHDVVKQMLRQLLAALHLEEHVDGRCFVDTAPIDERYWAERCGLGWRGKNCQLIIPHAGSYFFLGELVLTHDVDAYDHPMPTRCGTCRACLDACPMQALTGDGSMDARRCLSYLTIEHRGDLPQGLGEKMAPYFYGCDRCAQACPWNRFAQPTNIAPLQPRTAILAMTPSDWKHLTVEQYTRLFQKSAVKRAKYAGLMRNIQALSTPHTDDADEAHRP